MKKSLLLFFLLLSTVAFSQTSIVFNQAKFKTGDNPQWKDPNFDDSGWAFINTTIRWEEQGYKKYDGYAWYRLKFKLSSAMKNSSYWKDTLSVLLSKIDDVDESFLNGVKIGQTGLLPTDPGGPLGKWDTFRIYNIPSDSKVIRWDGDNVIAIRVYDTSNGGGVFGPAPSVRMKAVDDAIDIKLTQNASRSNYYNVRIINTSNKTLSGLLTLKLKDGATNRILKSYQKKFTLNLNKVVSDSILVTPNIRQEIIASFTENNTGVVKSVTRITPYILTPAPSPIPKINSPAIFGVHPGSPFLFKVAATGKGSLHYSATGLPDGLILDNATGIITGKISTKGEYIVRLSVTNNLGRGMQILTIKAGDKLALTPPMGWNSWNCLGVDVSRDNVISSANTLISKGLVNHGWTYINIDDGWVKPNRDKNGNMVPEAKFNDMQNLGDWLHSKGLKFGIYSSPGPKTCAGYLGSYQYETNDASLYAKWGVDYFKYDWCSYEDIIGNDTSLVVYQKPYQIMQRALLAQPRDIIYSLCQYGLKDVWKWGDLVSGNCWRTTIDIKDNWESVKAIGFGHPELYKYAKPGNWNDPDMLVLGNVGWSGKIHPTLLTPDEQYSHFSQWCLLSAPLLIGCDLNSIDNFTLSLLTNDEVIAIDQDILGKQAQQKFKTPNYEIWVKELQDGSMAVGLFNMSKSYQNIPLNFSTIGLKGTCLVRDLWRQKNIGLLKNGYTTAVPPHGVTLIKLTSK